VQYWNILICLHIFFFFLDFVCCVNCHYCCVIYYTLLGISYNMNFFTYGHFLLSSFLAFTLPLYLTPPIKYKEENCMASIFQVEIKVSLKICSLNYSSFMVTKWLLLRLFPKQKTASFFASKFYKCQFVWDLETIIRTISCLCLERMSMFSLHLV
jgi:hypothetical protein